MYCGKCKGTGIAINDPKSACDICGGRGHYHQKRAWRTGGRIITPEEKTTLKKYQKTLEQVFFGK